MRTFFGPIIVGLTATAAATGASAQTAGPLNASPASVQAPTTAVFLEQGTASSSITANVGARYGDITFSLGLRSGEGSTDGPTNLLESATGLVNRVEWWGSETASITRLRGLSAGGGAACVLPT